MLAVRGMDVRDNFKSICDQITGGETVVVARPQNQNVVMLSEAVYNELIKAAQNAEYLAKLDRSFDQLERGEVVIKSMEELEQMANE